MHGYFYLSFLLFLGSWSPRAWGGVDTTGIERMQAVLPPLESDLAEFDFDTYRSYVVIEDILALEAERRQLRQLGYDDVAFMEAFFDHYLSKQQLATARAEEITALMYLANRYELAGQLLVDSTLLYPILSDRIYSKISTFIQQEVDNGQYSHDVADIRYWSRSLAERAYHIRFPVSDVEKGLTHLSNGNVRYVLNRVWTDHKGVLLLVGCALMLLNAGVYYLLFRNWKRRAKRRWAITNS